MGDWRKSVYNYYTVVAFASKINIITCEKKKIYLNSRLFFSPVNRENYELTGRAVSDLIS